MMYATFCVDCGRPELCSGYESRARVSKSRRCTALSTLQSLRVNSQAAPLSCSMKAWRSAGALMSSGT